MTTNPNLKQTYNSILLGYSSVVFGGRNVFIKHFNCLDSFEIDDFYQNAYNKAISDNILTDEERLKNLISLGLWNKDKEEEISQKHKFLANLRTNKSKVFLKAQQDELTAEILKVEREIYAIQVEKSSLMGSTAENLAAKPSNEFSMVKSFFIDKELKTPLIESLDDLEDNEINNLITVYNKDAERFNPKNIQKIALLPYFTNVFYLCENDCFRFFGRAALNLTLYQIELFNQGCYFKGILSEIRDTITPELLNNPEELISIYSARKNIQDVESTSKTQAGTTKAYVGMTQEDAKRLGISHGGEVNHGDLLAKHGGKLTKMQIMQAEGLI
jgi:hypothetical protein